jgi:hypothetical protein
MSCSEWKPVCKGGLYHCMGGWVVCWPSIVQLCTPLLWRERYPCAVLAKKMGLRLKPVVHWQIYCDMNYFSQPQDRAQGDKYVPNCFFTTFVLWWNHSYERRIGNMGITPFILNLGTRWWVVNFTPRSLDTRETTHGTHWGGLENYLLPVQRFEHRVV